MMEEAGYSRSGAQSPGIVSGGDSELVWHRLDLAGKTNRHGVPKDPLALGLLWELQDGYLAGAPALLQRLVLGSLARLARLVCYQERLMGSSSRKDERVRA